MKKPTAAQLSALREMREAPAKRTQLVSERMHGVGYLYYWKLPNGGELREDTAHALRKYGWAVEEGEGRRGTLQLVITEEGRKAVEGK